MAAGEELATAAAPPNLGAEAVRLLQRLIRIDTVNPPGNERQLQLMLVELLSEAGFECELVAAESERPNLIARLTGESDGPTLAFLGHVDTVRADPEEWSRDPWGGELVDGHVWGRGALDMKGQVAAEIAAAAGLARGGWRPPGGELKLVITADEEAGASSARAGCASSTRTRSAPTSLSTREGGVHSSATAAASTRSRLARRGFSAFVFGPGAGRGTPPCRGSGRTLCSSSRPSSRGWRSSLPPDRPPRGWSFSPPCSGSRSVPAISTAP